MFISTKIFKNILNEIGINFFETCMKHTHLQSTTLRYLNYIQIFILIRIRLLIISILTTIYDTLRKRIRL